MQHYSLKRTYCPESALLWQRFAVFSAACYTLYFVTLTK